eukprot:TRINITY_DN2970_c0_g1_i1.p1 TRINITY_DN2970_c0_g1~~TRINITY_DN2970_c0_g1_i1.p1  ORF type:complete len:102 (-),score=19.87 TRINITY_DN2970_c0_g1_i1:162-467(-)
MKITTKTVTVSYTEALEESPVAFGLFNLSTLYFLFSAIVVTVCASDSSGAQYGAATFNAIVQWFIFIAMFVICFKVWKKKYLQRQYDQEERDNPPDTPLNL